MIKEFQNTVILSTNRINIRKINENDFDAFHRMQSDFQVMQYTTMRAMTLEENQKDFQSVLSKYDEADPKLLVWGVETDENSFIGTAALVKLKTYQWEIGFRLLRSFWGKGYGSEICQGLVDLCRNIPDIHELIAYADVRNHASNSVLIKCGFNRHKKMYNDEYQCEDFHYKLSVI